MANAIVILGFAAIVAFLVFLQVKHFVPFDFARLRGNASRDPLPTVFNNTTAREDGSGVSRTPLAKGFAVVFGLAFVFLMVTLVSDLKAKRDWDPQRTMQSPALVK